MQVVIVEHLSNFNDVRVRGENGQEFIAVLPKNCKGMDACLVH